MADRATRLNLSATIASVSVAAALVLVKLWALAATGALSVAASLADSGVDLMVSLGGLAAVAYAARPPDEDHAFGHSSAEDLAALGQSAFILVSAAVIALAALARLAAEAPPALAAETRGLVAMGVSLALTIGLVVWQRHVARLTESRVVQADSLHYLGDIIPNIGAAISLAASAWFGLERIDSVVALAAAVILVVGAVRIGARAWHALMDRAADPEMVAGIEAIVQDWPDIHGYHDLKTRTAGTQVFVNIHLELDGRQSLKEAHDTGAALRRAIVAAYPQADVIIHHDPV